MQQVQMQGNHRVRGRFRLSHVQCLQARLPFVGAATSAARPLHALLDLDDRLLKDIGETWSGRHAR